MTDDFIEFGDGFGLLSMNYKSIKRMDLPIELLYKRHNNSDPIYFLLIILFAISAVAMTFGARRGSHYQLVAGVLCLAFVGVLFVALFRKSLSRWQIGAGKAVISAAGFRDSRLSDQTVAWGSCKSAKIDRNPKSGNVNGVVLKLADGIEAPKTSRAYRQAFLLPRNTDRCLYVELDGVRKAMDVARAVCALVLRHQQQS